jgi:hypothetical protein
MEAAGDISVQVVRDGVSHVEGYVDRRERHASATTTTIICIRR